MFSKSTQWIVRSDNRNAINDVHADWRFPLTSGENWKTQSWDGTYRAKSRSWIVLSWCHISEPTESYIPISIRRLVASTSEWPISSRWCPVSSLSMSSSFSLKHCQQRCPKCRLAACQIHNSEGTLYIHVMSGGCTNLPGGYTGYPVYICVSCRAKTGLLVPGCKHHTGTFCDVHRGTKTRAFFRKQLGQCVYELCGLEWLELSRRLVWRECLVR